MLYLSSSHSSGMAADVSSLARYMGGRRTVGSEASPEKQTALITRDLLGAEPTKIESEELDLDLDRHVPAGWEKRLDLEVSESSSCYTCRPPVLQFLSFI